jgi:serine/threonine protein kinase
MSCSFASYFPASFLFLVLFSVCLILELCAYGSLSDVLRGSNAHGVNRLPLKLLLADRMHLALGCASGLQALHNYSPDLCHRDIKSMNFLSKHLVFLFSLRSLLVFLSLCLLLFQLILS